MDLFCPSFISTFCFIFFKKIVEAPPHIFLFKSNTMYSKHGHKMDIDQRPNNLTLIIKLKKLRKKVPCTVIYTPSFYHS